ncbi:hypothetical protein ACHAXM_011259 [Skeletonema potamos]
MLKFKKRINPTTTTMKRRNYCLATTLLLLSIFLETTAVELVAVEASVREVADHSASSSSEPNDNIKGSREKVTNTGAVEDNSIDGDEENYHHIPSSIAKATLVGAKLRQQSEGDKTDASDLNNNNRHNIDINLLDWEELPSTMQEAALTLGCNSQMWDNGEESSQCELFWSELTQEEQKAAMVLGYQSSTWDNDENGQEEDDEDELNTSEVVGDDVYAANNPKAAHVSGCHHWGAMGCNKGTASWNANAGSTTTASKINATPGVIVDDDGDDDDATMPHHQSSLAGSATAKIEAHVMKGAGQSSLSAKKDLFKAKKVGLDSSASNNPPQGFTLAARIVTSPHDGLSYFLEVPEKDMSAMMTIPYTYVSCGQNVESTSEAFSLDDLVVRHLPAGADISHWVNLGGGVTIDTDDDDEGSSPRYINGNHDGRPKLLVALTPIEIVVSGNDEESRIFSPGEIILMEDTLGKGHKMRANSRGKDLSVIMISLPHTVHYPAVNWSSVQDEHTNASPSDSASSWHSAAHQSLFGFAPKHRHLRSKARHATKPCPLEYDSAYSSLYTPTSHTKIRRKRRRRDRTQSNRNSFATSADSSDDSNYPPPPGFSTYNEHDQMSIFKYLPSLRQSMLIGIGLSLTSSFVYCAQLLYPPFLALWGGATVVVLGALVNVSGARWLYQQNWMVVWEEERRWKREVKRHKKLREAEAIAKRNETAVDESE